MWLTRLTRSGARAAIVPRGMRHVRSSHAVVDRWDSLERNLNFVLYDVLPGRDLCKKERFAAHDQSTFDAFLKTTINIAAKELAPLNHFVDANEPAYVNGEAKVPQPVHQAVKAMADSGYIASLSSVELGGLQLPYVVATACTYALQTASVGIASYLMLTHAAAHLLAVHGSENQVATFVPPMLEGRFTGTMCLSEPQAGSSLADITTTATPVDAASGVYSITGNKMWISGGDQDITENIVHLVLARIKGAPAGVKGISLFIVPKFLVKPDGSIGQRNDVALMGLNHKMGWRGTTNTALSFGENGQCTGYLIGKANHGLSYMFTMMNEARVGVGVCATALGTAGYYHSLEYATTRTQGRSATSRDPTQPQIPIIEHSDVKRMLVVQKAYTEGAMALCLYVAHLVDVVKCEEADSSEYVKATMLLDLLTPIVKSWPSEWCLEANKWAIQIFGGYGYTRDYPVEQCYRDNRLNMIHEGTNGIQALDLLGRKVGQHSGKALKLLAAEITATAQQAPAELKEHADALLKAVGTVGQTTQMLLEQGGRGNVDLMLANSHEYLNMFGNTIIAWMWLKQANAASSLLADPAAAKESADFYRGKLNACRFFFRHELPKVHLQAKLLQSLDDTILQVEPAGL